MEESECYYCRADWKNDPSKNISILISGSCQYYLIRQKKKKKKLKMRASLQRGLSVGCWDGEFILDYPDGAWMTCQVFLKDRGIGRLWNRRRCEYKSRGNATTHQGRLVATRSWKRQRQILPYSLHREYDPVRTLISAQWYWLWTSDLQKCGEINFCSLKLLRCGN